MHEMYLVRKRGFLCSQSTRRPELPFTERGGVSERSHLVGDRGRLEIGSSVLNLLNMRCLFDIQEEMFNRQ